MMYWIMLAILIIIALIVYSKHKGTVTLTKDQAELALGLIRKEMTEIENKRQEIIDNEAAKGKTVSLDAIFSHVENSPEPVRNESLRIKKEIFDKYGENIPIEVAYRLIKQLDPDEESTWSDNPGCFERHLRMREGNLLFPIDRRLVTKKEIEEAQKKDKEEQHQFIEKVQISTAKTESSSLSLKEWHAWLQEIQSLLVEAAEIGGDIGPTQKGLENLEESIINMLNEKMPDASDLLKKEQSLWTLQRLPFIAQRLRKDSPILKDDEIPTLLSEDLQTIALAGYISRSCDPDFRPNEMDIKTYLGKTVELGFSQDRANQIIKAWNEKKEAMAS
jgi:hypothetical protein